MSLTDQHCTGSSPTASCSRLREYSTKKSLVEDYFARSPKDGGGQTNSCFASDKCSAKRPTSRSERLSTRLHRVTSRRKRRTRRCGVAVVLDEGMRSPPIKAQRLWVVQCMYDIKTKSTKRIPTPDEVLWSNRLCNTRGRWVLGEGVAEKHETSSAGTSLGNSAFIALLQHYRF